MPTLVKVVVDTKGVAGLLILCLRDIVAIWDYVADHEVQCCITMKCHKY